jgi:hypothetical protein
MLGGMRNHPNIIVEIINHKTFIGLVAHAPVLRFVNLGVASSSPSWDNFILFKRLTNRIYNYNKLKKLIIYIYIWTCMNTTKAIPKIISFYKMIK